MSSGAMINIIALVVLTPFVTRIFSKEEFGVFYIFMSVVNISTLVVTGMYPHALVIPKEKNEFLALLKLCISLTITGSLIFGVFLLLFSNKFLGWINGEALSSYYYFLPLAILISGTNSVLQNWNVRQKEFVRNASSNVVEGTSERGFQMTFGYIFGGVFPFLIYSRMITDCLKAITLFSKSMIVDLKTLKSVSSANVKQVAKTYIKYPKMVLSGNFINKLTADIPLYLLAGYFGPSAVGAFGFASRMLNIPFKVLGGSIAPVYFQRANELYLKDEEALRKFTINSYDKLLILGGLAFGVVFSFGDILFNFVFGEEWNLAGRMARVLSIYYAFKIISSPFASIFRVVRKEEYAVYTNIVMAVLRVSGIFIGLLTGDLILAVLWFSIFNTLGYFGTNLLVFKVQGIPLYKIIFGSVVKISIIFGLIYSIRILIVNQFL